MITRIEYQFSLLWRMSGTDYLQLFTRKPRCTVILSVAIDGRKNPSFVCLQGWEALCVYEIVVGLPRRIVVPYVSRCEKYEDLQGCHCNRRVYELYQVWFQNREKIQNFGAEISQKAATWKTWRRWVDDINLDLREIGYETEPNWCDWLCLIIDWANVVNGSSFPSLPPPITVWFSSHAPPTFMTLPTVI